MLTPVKCVLYSFFNQHLSEIDILSPDNVMTITAVMFQVVVTFGMCVHMYLNYVCFIYTTADTQNI